MPIVRQGPGHFLAEVAQLSGRPALVDGDADDDVEALLVPPEQLRALIIAEADLGERIVRALILRRVGLIESGASGPVLIGAPQSPDVLRLQDFLKRNGQPHHVVDAAQDADAAALLEHARRGRMRRRSSLCPNGSVLLNPGRGRAGALPRHGRHAGARRARSTWPSSAPDRRGSRPRSTRPRRACTSSCSTAASYGGQAGASARIENYLGFPTGISGQALAGRAFVQAQKFGAEMLIPAQAAALDCDAGGPDGELRVALTDGRRLRARTVVIASGARYRRPDVPRLAEFEGRGVWYWASALEAKMCADRKSRWSAAAIRRPGGGVPRAARVPSVNMLVRGAEPRRQHVALPDRSHRAPRRTSSCTRTPS